MLPFVLAAVYLLGLLSAYIFYRVKLRSTMNEVLFFPDEKMPCRTFYQQLDNKETQCKQPHCQFAHLSDGTTSFMRIMQILQEANGNIDLCVYDFTESKLADFLIKKFNEGIKIRIVTDAHVERKFVSSSGGGGPGGGGGGGASANASASANGNASASASATSGNTNNKELIVIHTNADKSKEQKNHARQKSKDRQNNKSKDDKNKQQQPNENPNHKGHNNKHNTGKGKQPYNQQKEPPPAVQMQRVSHKGDQIPSLQTAGIPIRVNAVNGPFGALMHNKFVIVDNKYLMMGSFNWTHSAITRNHEAILLTDNHNIVSKFRNKFKDMWLHLQDRPVDPKF